MAENAYNNGVEFKFDTEVKEHRKQGKKVLLLETSKGDLETGCIVNAAGVYADVFHNMVSEKNNGDRIYRRSGKEPIQHQRSGSGDRKSRDECEKYSAPSGDYFICRTSCT